MHVFTQNMYTQVFMFLSIYFKTSRIEILETLHTIKSGTETTLLIQTRSTKHFELFVWEVKRRDVMHLEDDYIHLHSILIIFCSLIPMKLIHNLFHYNVGSKTL